MRRWAALAAVLMAVAAGRAGAVGVGLGLAGGVSVPLAQEDNALGGSFGVRVPVNVIPLLTIEPFLTSTSPGRTEETFAGQPYNRRGFDLLSYGATLTVGEVELGPRWPIHPFVGVGAYRMTREGTDGATHPGYMVGLGYARRLPHRMALDLRAEFDWIVIGTASRKFFGLSLGVAYKIHPDDQEEF